MWIFGYGSLIWKVDFPYVDKKHGYIRGYVRRFWQASNDHRGTVENPGRVVTLIEHKEFIQSQDEFIKVGDNQSINNGDVDVRVYGVAYKISDRDRDDVLKRLDHREKHGYVTERVQFHVHDSDECLQEVLVYIGTSQNEAFVGHTPVADLARHILNSKGPSGYNLEYLLELHHSHGRLYPLVADHHLDALVEEIQRLIQQGHGDDYCQQLHQKFVSQSSRGSNEEQSQDWDKEILRASDTPT
ncbi:hypothetical protein MIR68_000739 [Amoeboaphelidium protococcarum]|nr:hypothetical protein MIR68_000739 [Amoeboaphelidium protococcarum]